MVYFIVETEIRGGRVKIGYTTNIKSRFGTLLAYSPYLLSLVLLEEGSPAREAQIHQEFDEFRVRGEWFHLSEPIATYISGELLRLGKIGQDDLMGFYDFIGYGRHLYGPTVDIRDWQLKLVDAKYLPTRLDIVYREENLTLMELRGLI